MRDYVLAIGPNDAYGFSAPDDRAAIRHAADYMGTTETGDPHGSHAPVVLNGPDGLLTRPDEDVESLRSMARLHVVESTDDIRAGDPTPPDCNTA